MIDALMNDALFQQGADAKEAAKAQFRALLVRMDEAYALTAVKNAEIRFHWHIVRPVCLSVCLAVCLHIPTLSAVSVTRPMC